MTARPMPRRERNVLIDDSQQLWPPARHYRKQTYGAERVTHLSSLLLFDTQAPTHLERVESVLTWDNAQTLKFTLIVQRMRSVAITRGAFPVLTRDLSS